MVDQELGLTESEYFYYNCYFCYNCLSISTTNLLGVANKLFFVTVLATKCLDWF